MGELGLLGVPWPEALGGAGLDYLSYIITIHEMAKVDASHAHHDLRAHDARHVADRPLRHRGSSSERYVPLLAAGKVLGGFGLTEPTPAATPAARGRPPCAERPLRPQRRRSASSRTAASARSSSSPRSPIRRRARRASARSSSRSRRRDLANAQRRRHRARCRRCRRMPGFRAGKKEDKLGWRASDTARADLRGRRGAGREPARRGGRGLRQLHADARRRPHRHRRAVARHRRGRVRGRR